MQGFDVIFYGDSITEQWRGSGVGSFYPDLQETKRIFMERFNQNYSSHVLAIAGKRPFALACKHSGGDMQATRAPIWTIQVYFFPSVFFTSSSNSESVCLADEQHFCVQLSFTGHSTQSLALLWPAQMSLLRKAIRSLFMSCFCMDIDNNTRFSVLHVSSGM